MSFRTYSQYILFWNTLFAPRAYYLYKNYNLIWTWFFSLSLNFQPCRGHFSLYPWIFNPAEDIFLSIPKFSTLPRTFFSLSLNFQPCRGHFSLYPWIFNPAVYIFLSIPEFSTLPSTFFSLFSTLPRTFFSLFLNFQPCRGHFSLYPWIFNLAEDIFGTFKLLQKFTDFWF